MKSAANFLIFSVVKRTLFIFSLLLLFCFSANAKSFEKNASTIISGDTIKKKTKDPFTIKTYNTANIGWGYDILKDGKLLIHQPHIPAVSGTQGFATKEEAMKVAKLMKKKIQKNIMPPTIEIKELDELKIKYKI